MGARSIRGLYGGDNEKRRAESRARDMMSMIVVTLVGTALSSILGVASVYLAYRDGSSSALVVGFEILVGVIAAYFVVRRFYGELYGRDDAREIAKQERNGAFSEGILFIVFGLVASADAVLAIVEKDPIDQSSAILVVLYISTVSAFTEAALQWYYANRIQSLLAQEDALGQFAAGLMSLAAAITHTIIRHRPSFWWLDPTVGLVLSIMLVFFGAYYTHLSFHIEIEPDRDIVPSTLP
uniref:Transmembrane protein 163 n=1 Tax=Compsopogon caeruleus TaxID=31354 RepID=A0A7S1TH59_9RHOD